MTETEELIAKVRALDEAATKGPWYVDDVLWTVRPGPLEDGSYPHISLARLASTPADGFLIAEYRTLAPELVKALQEATADVAEPCDKYGLPHSARLLEQHLTTNAALTYEAIRQSIRALQDQLAAKDAALAEALAENARLREFAIWMTGCGFDFASLPYFVEHRHLLTSATRSDVPETGNYAGESPEPTAGEPA